MEITLLTTEEVSSIMTLAASTLRRWRKEGIGPPFIKLSGSNRGPVRYKLEDVEQYLNDKEIKQSII